MALFMDISRNDKSEVNSVLVGCSCGQRSIYIDVAEAQAWGREHVHAAQCSESKAFEQLGSGIRARKPKEPKAPKPRIQRVGPTPTHGRLLTLLVDRGGLSTEAVADSTASSYNTAYVNLRRMHKEGLISKTKTGNTVQWTAAPTTKESLCA